VRLLLFCLFLLLPTLTLGQSACYLFVGGELGGNSSKIDSIIRPLLAAFVAPLKQLPAAGISESKLASSCFYEVSLLSSGNGLDLSITGQHTPISLNGGAHSKLPFPDNVRHATLRILHKELSQPQKDQICRKYGELLVEECPQTQRLILVFREKRDSERESLSKEPRTILSSELESLFEELDSIEFLGVSKVMSGISFQQALGKTMNERGSNASLVISTDWEFQKQQTSMWKGLVSMTVTMESYSLKDGEAIKKGSYSVDPQKVPIRKWGKSQSFKRKSLLKISKKVTQKWSDTAIREFLQATDT